MQKTGQGNGAVVYVRVSTDEQANGPLNLQNQEQRCRDYCKRMGIHVAQVFVDPGESARSTDRPAFQQMLAYCKMNQRDIAFVVVQDLSRLARNLQDQGQTFYELNRIGILVRSVNESSIDESPEGKMQAGIFGTFNEYFSNALSKKMKERTLAAVSAGRFPWKAPIGYKNVGGNVGANIVPDPERASLIARAFELVGTGRYKKTEVLKIITDDGLKTTRGKALTPQTFQAVLGNALYAGWVTLPSDESFVPRRGLHTPIVSQELFDRVQEILSGKRPSAAPKRKFNPILPLKCLVKCEVCGTPLTGALCKGQRYGYYWCRRAGCRAVKLPKDKLEGEFVALLRKLRPNSAALSEFPMIAAKVWAEKQGDVEKQERKLKARLDEQRQLRRALRDAMLRGTITAEQFKEDDAEFGGEIAVTEQEIRALGSQRDTFDAFIRFAEIHLTDIAGAWEIAAPEQRQRVQNLLFQDGLLYSPEQGILNHSNSSLYSMLEATRSKKGLLVSPMGFEPMLSP
jgi:site-specific DNA recombinase